MNKKLGIGLFAAWAIHDIEEWLAIGSWGQGHGGDKNSRGGLRLPAPSTEQERTAIALMAVIFAAAAANGVRTGGRSRWFQATLAGFGLHGFGHIALSVAARGYTPGVITTPLVVFPFAGWAWKQLGKRGIRHSTGQTVRDAVPLMIGALAVAHTGAALLRRAASGRRRPSAKLDDRRCRSHDSQWPCVGVNAWRPE
ncbi:HXXEE domain-containing protein [Nocardia australiensis]|uniref:HXXEE domain-containing protein n=1 Tax=Nocardia australiensis TaxID=2887191 RepID=UPI001D147074|nr:HXXEE domain-containing protein [Nocardia australiensis]